jgi:hypothetical protein
MSFPFPFPSSKSVLECVGVWEVPWGMRGMALSIA